MKQTLVHNNYHVVSRKRGVSKLCALYHSMLRFLAKEWISCSSAAYLGEWQTGRINCHNQCMCLSVALNPGKNNGILCNFVDPRAIINERKLNLRTARPGWVSCIVMFWFMLKTRETKVNNCISISVLSTYLFHSKKLTIFLIRKAIN